MEARPHIATLDDELVGIGAKLGCRVVSIQFPTTLHASALLTTRNGLHTIVVNADVAPEEARTALRCCLAAYVRSYAVLR